MYFYLFILECLYFYYKNMLFYVFFNILIVLDFIYEIIERKIGCNNIFQSIKVLKEYLVLYVFWLIFFRYVLNIIYFLFIEGDSNQKFIDGFFFILVRVNLV